jgi:biotin carboxyl carrier protein
VTRRPLPDVRVNSDPAVEPDAEPVVVSAASGVVERRSAVGVERAEIVRVRLDNGSTIDAIVARDPLRPAAVSVDVDGWHFDFTVADARREELRRMATRGRSGPGSSDPLELRTPIPGRVVSVAVSVGDRVTSGQPLLVVEAMKMQNEVRAPRAGTVVRLDVTAGRPVDARDLLAVIEPGAIE